MNPSNLKFILTLKRMLVSYLLFSAIKIQLKEEDRLAAVISIIDEEARIVPRGAYIMTPVEQVHTNRSFEGT